MNKKLTSKIMALALLASSALPLASCGGGGGGGLQYDKTKTPLIVWNYNGGYGTEWLEKAEKRFEDAYSDFVLGDKTGVDVVLDPTKDNIMQSAPSIPGGDHEVFFVESSYYYTLQKQGVLADITDVITKTNKFDGKTIESKMTEEQKSYFGIEENGEMHYYGLPHVNTFVGLNYNVQLFEDKLFYFAATPDSADTSISRWFITSLEEQKSLGPDGKTGIENGVDYSLDDGLPATYDEFFILLEYMEGCNVTPISWNGYRNTNYLNWFLHSLVADYEGLDQMMLNYTFDGEATSLGTIVNGEFVADEKPTYISETTGNESEITRQAGKYYALKFIERLADLTYSSSKKTNTAYARDGVYNTAYMHTAAQSDFLLGNGNKNDEGIGILIEGIWWQNEAYVNGIFEAAKTQGITKENAKFAVMPLPNANGKQKTKNTLVDQLYSMAFVSSGIAEEKKQLAFEFVQFVNSDPELVNFTKSTETPKALNYEMSESDLSELSYYGKSVWEMKSRSDIVYPYAQSNMFMKNQSNFSIFESYWSKIDGKSLQYPINAFKDGKTAEAYFSGLKGRFEDVAWAK